MLSSCIKAYRRCGHRIMTPSIEVKFFLTHDSQICIDPRFLLHSHTPTRGWG